MTSYQDMPRPSKLVEDGVGSRYTELPKLNLSLLEQAVRWANASAKGKLQDHEPKWLQGTWGDKRWWKKLVPTRNEKGQFSGTEVKHYCKTNYCIFGYVLEETNNVTFGVNWKDLNRTTVQGYTYEVEVSINPVIQTPNGEMEIAPGDFYTAGAAVLGLTPTEAQQLFSGCNAIYKIKLLARRIAASRGETLHL